MEATFGFLGGVSWAQSNMTPAIHDRIYPYTNSSTASSVVQNWIDGSFEMLPCAENNCSLSCTSEWTWIEDFGTCSLYPLFSQALLDNTIFNSSHVSSLNSQGIYADISLAFEISTVVRICLAEFCEFSSGCLNGPGASSCTNAFELENTTSQVTGKAIKNPTVTADCLTNAICSSIPEVNADFGGVGMFASYVMQTLLSIIANWSLLIESTISTRIPRLSKKLKRHFQALITAVVEFHKAQCYFAAAIQIAGIKYCDGVKQRQDVSVLYIISTVGLVPVSFTLQSIASHGRLSWYVVLLSICSWLLSTILLVKITMLGFASERTTGFSNPSQIFPACGNIYGFGAGLPDKTPLCTYDNWTYGSPLTEPRLTSRFVWLAWAISTLWISYSTGKMANKNQGLSRLIVHFTSGKATERKENHHRHGRPVMVLFSFLSRLVSFSIQGYFFSAYISSKEFVPHSWQFGQIVAITVWIPSAIEYVYLEICGMKKGSEYRLGSGLTVVEVKEAVKLPAGNRSTTGSKKPHPTSALLLKDSSRVKTHEITELSTRKIT